MDSPCYIIRVGPDGRRWMSRPYHGRAKANEALFRFRRQDPRSTWYVAGGIK